MNINRLIFKYFIEIFALIFIIFITYPVWQVLGESKGAKIAESYANYEHAHLSMYFDKAQDLNNLYPIEDGDVNKSNYTNINVVNNSKNDMNYSLVIAVSKTSTINAEYIKVSVNNSIYILSDLYLSGDEYINYYLIDEGIISKNSMNNIKMYMWLSKDASNDMQGKNMEFNYKLIEKNI